MHPDNNEYHTKLNNVPTQMHEKPLFEGIILYTFAHESTTYYLVKCSK